MFRAFGFNSGKFPLPFTFNSASFAVSSRVFPLFPTILPLKFQEFPSQVLDVHHFPHISVPTLHSSARLRGRHVANPTGRRTRRRKPNSAGTWGVVSTIDGVWDGTSCVELALLRGALMDLYGFVGVSGFGTFQLIHKHPVVGKTAPAF